MTELTGFEKIPDKECQGFKVRQKVVPKKNDTSPRTGEIRAFLRSVEDGKVVKASISWTFTESGSKGSNYELLSNIKPSDGEESK